LNKQEEEEDDWWSEEDKIEWWQRILADARSIDQTISWEIIKIVAGVEGAVVRHLITRKQADTVHAMINRDTPSDSDLTLTMSDRDARWRQYKVDKWNHIFAEAHSLDREDPWQQFKFIAGAGNLRAFTVIPT